MITSSRPIGSQDAPQLGAVARSEHVHDDIGDGIGDRQRTPRVAADRADPGVCPCRLAQRMLRQVKRQPCRTRQAVKHGGEVVAGTRADIDDAAWP